MQRRLSWFALALGLSLAGCQLFGQGDVPCETDDNCPAGQYCSDDKVCRDGQRHSTADAAVDAGTVNDAAGRDGAGTDLVRPDSAGTDQARPDAAGTDLGPRSCASPPCSLMPDSLTATCRESDTVIAATCPSSGNLFGQDGNHHEIPPSYSSPATGVVHDDVTQLLWEQVPAFETGIWDDAVSHCDGLDLAGHSDWRLPTARELITLIDFGKAYPDAAIDTLYFPSPSNKGYWSSSGHLDYYWVIDFWGGPPSIEIDTNYTETYAVRCVRGAQHVGGELQFGAGTWIDLKSGLEWQAVSAADLNMYEALATCEGLTLNNHDDWRLPSIKELETIVDRDRSTSPATYSEFENDVTTSPREYWSSTPYLVDYGYGFWVVMFDDADETYRYGSSDKHVRCVRGP